MYETVIPNALPPRIALQGGSSKSRYCCYMIAVRLWRGKSASLSVPSLLVHKTMACAGLIAACGLGVLGEGMALLGRLGQTLPEERRRATSGCTSATGCRESPVVVGQVVYRHYSSSFV